jgi:hypothetical protein
MEDFLATDQTAILFVEVHDMDQVNRDEIIDIIVSSGFDIEFVSQDGGESVVTDFCISELKQISSNVHIFATRGVRNEL